MPTYVCATDADLLDDAKRGAIAAAITDAHSAATGAPRFFVQVVFDEKPKGRRFLGGTPADGHVWIRGDIRDGRSPEVRAQLMTTILRDVARILALPDTAVWVYLNALAPTDMIEYGHVLPQPGAEQAWFDALPPDLRAHLTALGASASRFTL